MTRKRTLIVALLVGLLVALTGCTGQSSQRSKDEAASDATYQKQILAQPFPAQQLINSLERANLRKRLLRENVPNQIRYVYLLGDTGVKIGYYTIQGKVSSNQSQMLPQDDITKPCTGCDRYVVDGPADDGSYGDDAPGVFFFTTEDVLVSTDLRILVSDQPLPVDVPKFNGTVQK